MLLNAEITVYVHLQRSCIATRYIIIINIINIKDWTL
jgi:hypothetical protein